MVTKMCQWVCCVVMCSTTAVLWHVHIPPPQAVTDCGKSLAMTLLSRALFLSLSQPTLFVCTSRGRGDSWRSISDAYVCCRGEQHMVRHDLRTNTCARSHDPLPPPFHPLTNTQTVIYINYHVLLRSSRYSCGIGKRWFPEPWLVAKKSWLEHCITL